MLVVHVVVHVCVRNLHNHTFLSVEDFSYTRRDRLLNASQFTKVFNQANKSSSEFFTILSRENDIDQSRLGIVVAKRRVKRSVDRNVIKRIVRESFRLNKAKLPAYDFVVIIKRPVNVIKRSKLKLELKQQLDSLWKQY